MKSELSKTTKQMTKAEQERARVLSLLEESESDARSASGGEFEDMFEASVKERDFKVGDVVKGTVVEVQTDYRSRRH
jgi:small subunit ribosomal protein S1